MKEERGGQLPFGSGMGLYCTVPFQHQQMPNLHGIAGGTYGNDQSGVKTSLSFADSLPRHV